MVCGYVHEGKKPPEVCPQCGANLNRFIMLEPLSDELEGMLRMAFAGEAKAQVRNQAFAKQADSSSWCRICRCSGGRLQSRCASGRQHCSRGEHGTCPVTFEEGMG